MDGWKRPNRQGTGKDQDSFVKPYHSSPQLNQDEKKKRVSSMLTQGATSTKSYYHISNKTDADVKLPVNLRDILPGRCEATTTFFPEQSTSSPVPQPPWPIHPHRSLFQSSVPETPPSSSPSDSRHTPPSR